MYHIRHNNVPISYLTWYREHIATAINECPPLELGDLFDNLPRSEYKERGDVDAALDNLRETAPDGEFTVLQGSDPYLLFTRDDEGVSSGN